MSKARVSSLGYNVSKLEAIERRKVIGEQNKALEPVRRVTFYKCNFFLTFKSLASLHELGKGLVTCIEASTQVPLLVPHGGCLPRLHPIHTPPHAQWWWPFVTCHWSLEALPPWFSMLTGTPFTCFHKFIIIHNW